MKMSSIRTRSLAPRLAAGRRCPLSLLLLGALGCAGQPLSDDASWLQAQAEAGARDTTAPASATPDAVASVELATAGGFAVATPDAAASAPEGLAWRVEVGTAEAPLTAGGLGSSGSSVYVAGTVGTGAESDAQLAAYAGVDGRLLWARQLGSPEADGARASAAADGRVLLAGQTSGALGGQHQGFGDAFVAAYSELGELLWAHQLGTAAPDVALAVSVDPSGAVLVSGDTRGPLGAERDGDDRDAFLAKLSPEGALVYTRQLGSQPGYDDGAAGVAGAANGDVVLAGHTFGGVQGSGQGSADAFVARYSGAGELLWAAQLGTPGYDSAEAIGIDASGNAFVAGQAGGFARGPGPVVGARPLLAKYSPEGDLVWQVELDDAEMGAASAVFVDALGDVWIAGYTSASLAAPNSGAYDAFVARFTSDGERLLALQVGGPESERAAGLAFAGERLVLLSRVQGGALAAEGALLAAFDVSR